MKKLKLIAVFFIMFICTVALAQNLPAYASENKVNIFTGEVEVPAWNLAGTMKSTADNGNIDVSIFKEQGYFYVEYTGEKEGLQLILQSWSGGEGWAVADPSEAGVTEDNINYAKFDEESIKKVYKSDLSTTLNAVHVWNVKGGITLKSVDYVYNTEDKEEEDTNIKTIIPSEDNIRYLGRAYNYNNELWLAASATGAEFNFTGSKLEVTVLGDYMAGGEAHDDARIAFYVNDELVVDKMVTENESTVKVFESDKPETVKVTIVKLSECAYSTVGIKDIKVDSNGEISRTERKDRTIEFIGDSITCGYGVEDEDCTHGFKTSTENATKTYAYKTAQALDADINVTAYSGYGIVSGYSLPGVKNDAQIVSKYYDKVGFCYGAFASSQRIDELLWDFNKTQPDLVVINLGTNDTNYCNCDENKEDFKQGYVEFIKAIRDKNPNAKILCTLGIMGDGLFESIDSAVENYKTETGDLNIDTMKFDVQVYQDGFAADYHPTEKTHTKAAAKLTEKIKEIMNW